jgi:hypothetical protein
MEGEKWGQSMRANYGGKCTCLVGVKMNHGSAAVCVQMNGTGNLCSMKLILESQMHDVGI